MKKNEQEIFWETYYSELYIKNNSNFDEKLLIQGWEEILSSITQPPNSIIEFGANIGRNIKALNFIYPNSSKTAVEISKDATKILSERFTDLNVINSSIIESEVPNKSFDLAFTMVVLIHIHPDNLLQNLEKIINSSRRYVLVGEYFNRVPVSLTYQGQEDKLFKRDFGKYILEKFSDQLRLVDYGFLWGHIYDDAGFDDITWWIFERK